MEGISETESFPSPVIEVPIKKENLMKEVAEKLEVDLRELAMHHENDVERNSLDLPPLSTVSENSSEASFHLEVDDSPVKALVSTRAPTPTISRKGSSADETPGHTKSFTPSTALPDFPGFDANENKTEGTLETKAETVTKQRTHKLCMLRKIIGVLCVTAAVAVLVAVNPSSMMGENGEAEDSGTAALKDPETNDHLGNITEAVENNSKVYNSNFSIATESGGSTISKTSSTTTTTSVLQVQRRLKAKIDLELDFGDLPPEASADKLINDTKFVENVQGSIAEGLGLDSSQVFIKQISLPVRRLRPSSRQLTKFNMIIDSEVMTQDEEAFLRLQEIMAIESLPQSKEAFVEIFKKEFQTREEQSGREVAVVKLEILSIVEAEVVLKPITSTTVAPSTSEKIGNGFESPASSSSLDITAVPLEADEGLSPTAAPAPAAPMSSGPAPPVSSKSSASASSLTSDSTPSPQPSPRPSTPSYSPPSPRAPSGILSPAPQSPAPQSSVPRTKETDAQFLIQATFGPTRSSLAELEATDYSTWIQTQMDVPVSSHRAYYRSRANPRMQTAVQQGSPYSKCSAGSRWQNFAFTKEDETKPISIQNNEVRVDGTHRMDIDSQYIGNIIPAPSTCANDAPAKWISKGKSCTSGDKLPCQSREADWMNNKYCRQSCYDQGYGYPGDDCSIGWPELGTFNGYICSISREDLGAYMTISTDGTCKAGHIALPIPGLHFTHPNKYTAIALQFDTVRPGVIVLKQAADPCTLGNVIKLDGKFYAASTRLELLENTLDSPNIRSVNSCPTVPETFINEKNCVLQTTCTPLHLQSASLRLNKTSFQLFYNVEQKYVYSITGLRTTESPCGTLSRWQLLDCSCMGCSCSATASISAADSSAVMTQLQKEMGWLRDIHVTCEGADSIESNAVVRNGEEFWKHVHIHEHNVYDFTDWVDMHEGGNGYIQKWINMNFRITFPSGHLMERWVAGSTQNAIQYLGKLGDEIDFHSLPTSLQSQALADVFSASGVSGYFKSCGSPGETGNDPKLGNQVSFGSIFDDHGKGPLQTKTKHYKILARKYDNPYEQDPDTSSKSQVWTMLAINAKDQLRQRIAWALSQIFAVGSEGFGAQQMTESWLVYYDIFVRNAFGNFRDVLREVTYSPLMGNYLTYKGNQAYDVQQNYPDENYAREIMQLFTIGLFKLNSDGSYEKDANGANIPTYNNEHIMNFARVLTGFDEQLLRANIEKAKAGKNKIDPMQMKAEHHDVYPKPDLDGGFLGDGYPLCSDLPQRAFLAKGAQYKFLGYRHSQPELYVAPADSQLFNALCNGPSDSCNFALNVELSADLVCHDKECKMDTLQYIKTGNGYWEYLPPTCVHLFFFNGRVARDGRKWGNWLCKDPQTLSAGISCCGGCSNTPESCESADESSLKCTSSDNWVNKGYCRLACWQKGDSYSGDNCSAGLYQEKHMCGFPQERARFATAEANCAAQGLHICPTKVGTSTSDCDLDQIQVWTTEDCTNDIKVDADGKVSSQADANTKQNFISVPWQSGFPTVDSCPIGCTVSDGGCVCTPTVELEKVFDVVPSKSAALVGLKIGAFQPAGACSVCNGEVRAYITAGVIDEHTVFEVDGQFFKNAQSIVKVGAYSFRNAPVFLIAGWKTKRAALAEVESLLDHLSYHPNTPVFIAYRLIQRLVTSNPSPTFIHDVGQAFRTGQYGGKTYSGKYGDLGATVAAILLHPEARDAQASPTMGKLREPIIKVIHLFRAMEYSDDQNRQVILRSLEEEIGQSMTESPSVFNFYTPNYSPSRFSSGLVAPEFQIFTAPFAVGFLNGMTSLIDNGLVGCEGGFGLDGEAGGCDVDAAPTNAGRLSLSKPDNVQETIDLLDLLLTGGRLHNTKTIVKAAIEEASESDQLKAAQKVVLLSPEFHTIGSPQFSGTRPAETKSVTNAPRNYKAAVMLFLDGGADTFNLLVPMKCPLYDEYMTVRKDIGLQPSYLHEISTTGQRCESFGIHYALPFLKTLYDKEQAAFVSNVGSLVEPTTRKQWKNGLVSSCVGLFSHLDQQMAAATLQCQTPGAGPQGAGGRLADALSDGSQKYTTTSFSIKGTHPWGQGFKTKLDIVGRKHGALRFRQYAAMETTLGNITSQRYGNIYTEEYAKQLKEAMTSSEDLGEYLDHVTLTTSYKAETKLQQEFHQVARLIKARDLRKAERDLFVVRIGGFDSHRDAGEALQEKFTEINDALEGFVAELEGQDVFKNTVIFTESDFGRTLTSNGAGTDHGWAGNHFIIGGDIQGKKVFNAFPDSLLEGNDYDAGRGRLIPKYPWESMMVPIAEWMGVEAWQRASVFPNLANFNSSHIITRSSLFK